MGVIYQGALARAKSSWRWGTLNEALLLDHPSTKEQISTFLLLAKVSVFSSSLPSAIFGESLNPIKRSSI